MSIFHATKRAFVDILRPALLSPSSSADPRHLAIAGLSYCGSTLVSTMLGNLPGVMNIGESHWLIERRENFRTLPADLENVAYQKQHQCRQCGEACAVFSRDFRIELEKDPTDWYEKIHARMGDGFMVSSDKTLNRLKALDPALRMHLLVLFRSPAQNAKSYVANRERKFGKPISPEKLGKYLDSWTSSYKNLLSCKNRGQKLFLNFEAFASDPETHLQKICEIFDLSFDASAVDEVAPGQHYLGGNRRVARMLRANDQKIKVDAIEKPSFDEERQRVIDEHERSRSMFDKLMQRYHERFAPDATQRSSLQAEGHARRGEHGRDGSEAA